MRTCLEHFIAAVLLCLCTCLCHGQERAKPGPAATMRPTDSLAPEWRHREEYRVGSLEKRPPANDIVPLIDKLHEISQAGNVGYDIRWASPQERFLPLQLSELGANFVYQGARSFRKLCESWSNVGWRRYRS